MVVSPDAEAANESTTRRGMCSPWDWKASPQGSDSAVAVVPEIAEAETKHENSTGITGGVEWCRG